MKRPAVRITIRRIAAMLVAVSCIEGTLWPGFLNGQDGGALLKLQEAIFNARDKVLPALVHVQPISEIYSGGRKVKGTGIGSGVIFRPDGHVLTNFHVAGKAETLICTLSNREEVSAKLVGADPFTDIAVIKLDLSKLDVDKVPFAALGDSDKLEAGQFVIALGSPMTLARSMTYGIVSRTERYTEVGRLPTGEVTGTYNTWIQTDAAINRGNSGGPLVDLKGEVVGINARKGVFADNIGFAIPINVVKEVAEQLIKTGEVKRSWIGLEFQPMRDFEQRFGQKGALIGSVAPGSPAEEAGIQAGDILFEYDGHSVSARFEEDIPAIAKMIADTDVGKDVKIRLRRGKEAKVVSLRTTKLHEVVGEDFECKEWGLTVQSITKQMKIEYSLSNTQGVRITGVVRGGAADKGKVAAGDIIKSVGAIETSSLSGFKTAYNNLVKEKKNVIMLKMRRRGGSRRAVLKPKYEDKKAER